MAGLRKPVDWEAIQNDYRAGIKSLRMMAGRVRDLACIDQEACGQGGLEQGSGGKDQGGHSSRSSTGHG